MQALIDFIINNLKALWPIFIIAEWETAFVTRKGKVHRIISSGLHWKWLFIEKVYRAWSTEINVDLDNATILSSDNKPVIISGNLGYTIHDLPKLWQTLSDSSTTIKHIALGHIASVCNEKTLDDLSQNNEKLHKDTLRKLKSKMKKYGITITRIQFTDLVNAKAYRLYGNTAKTQGDEGHDFE
jgi:regulator of protease activity HflC (stomatin/prohibitin superfamily)